MNKIIILCLLLFLASCSKSSNPVTSGNPSMPLNARFIPNWHDNDTLYGYTTDTLGQFNGADTVITKTVNDTSMILYKGKRYHIWWNPISVTDTFKADQLQYSNMSISTTPDTSGVISKGLLNGAAPHKYKDQQGVTMHQRQAIMVNMRANTPFVAWNGYYQSMRVY